MAKNDPDPKSFMDAIFGEFEKINKKIDERIPEKKADPPTPDPAHKAEPKTFWDFFFGE